MRLWRPGRGHRGSPHSRFRHLRFEQPFSAADIVTEPLWFCENAPHVLEGAFNVCLCGRAGGLRISASKSLADSVVVIRVIAEQTRIALRREPRYLAWVGLDCHRHGLLQRQA